MQFLDNVLKILTRELLLASIVPSFHDTSFLGLFYRSCEAGGFNLSSHGSRQTTGIMEFQTCSSISCGIVLEIDQIVYANKMRRSLFSPQDCFLVFGRITNTLARNEVAKQLDACAPKQNRTEQ
uniref:Secreted protein n=1 Tax=Steinernema glaseri TaxID=37863 RepID=A0A1I8AJ84_9BILA